MEQAALAAAALLLFDMLTHTPLQHLPQAHPQLL
jgi:hypothetical protein